MDEATQKWERERRGDAPRAPRRRSQRRGRMSLLFGPCRAARARGSERSSKPEHDILIPRKGRADCQARPKTVTPPTLRFERTTTGRLPHVAPRAVLRDGWRGASRRVPLPLHQLRATNSRGRVRRVRATTFTASDVDRPIDRSIDRSIPETPEKDADTPPPRPTRFRASQARRVAQGRG